jgi:N-methylhydantoinase A/oxoprolinase/acetone carboxylase beta subunit
VVHASLDAQLKRTLPGEYDGRFVRKMPVHDEVGLVERDAALFAKLSLDIQPMNVVIKSRLEAQALIRLVGRGLAQISALTPSDASHVLGYTDVWDRDAATKALKLFGRRRNGAGALLGQDAKNMAQIIVDQLTHQTSTALLQAAFAEEDTDFSNAPQTLAAHPLMQQGLTGHKGLVRIETGLNVPVVGLGASASRYYPAVGERLNCKMILPEHAGVANAIGAVVGRITMRASGTVTAPSDGVFRLHLEDGLEDFAQETAALQRLEHLLREIAISDAKNSGAEDLQVTVHNDIRKANIEAIEMFVEATITVTVTGRPRITSS